MRLFSTGAPIQRCLLATKPQAVWFDVVGNVIDGGKPVTGKQKLPVFTVIPTLAEQSNKTEILETGIKVIDLIAPLTKGGKAGLFAGVLVLVNLCLFKNSLTILLPTTLVTRSFRWCW